MGPISLEERQWGGVAAEPAEFRMRFQELLQRAAAQAEVTEEPVLGPYLTISREAGSGGGELARRVGDRLKWTVLDRELVNDLAKRLEIEPRLLELMDETRVGWFSETLLNLFNSRLLLQSSYISMISRAMALAAIEGRVVIVGRAGNLVLSPQGGLRVRVIAPRESRLAALAERDGLDERTAARRLDQLDASRANFVRRHFHRDLSDPRDYDLVIDVGGFGIERATDLVCHAIELRGLV